MMEQQQPQQQQQRPKRQRAASSSTVAGTGSRLPLLALAAVAATTVLTAAPQAAAFVVPGPAAAAVRPASAASSFVRPPLGSAPVVMPLQQPALRPLAATASSGDDKAAPAATTNNKKAAVQRQPLSEKALQWLPSALRSGLLALAAFSPLVAYNAGADAAQSGGRVGGSGFRSAPSQTRRYAAPPSRSSSSYSSPRSSARPYSPPPPTRGYVERVPMPVPVVPYSPFGFGGFGGFGISPFMPFGGGVTVVRSGWGVDPLDVIILGGFAYAAYNILKNSVGGSQWEVDESAGPSSLGTGVTVLKIQVGLQVANRAAKASILGQLDDIAKTADVSTRQGLSNLVSTTALALLRSSGDWVSAYGESRQFGKGEGKAEAEYSRLAVRERAKFEKEVNMMTRRSLDQQPYLVDARPTLAVVTICVAIRGQATKLPTSLNSAARLREALQTLAADAMTDEGENVLATEVLWTPQDEGDVLTKRDLIADYPELIDL